MKRGPIALLAALALAVIGLQPISAWADDLPTVEVDVAAANGSYDGYSVNDESVIISEPETVYVLSGSTGKRIFIDNSDLQKGDRFLMRLNNATVSGGIEAHDDEVLRLIVDVPTGTVNYVDHLSPLGLAVSGGGVLNAECINAGPAKTDDVVFGFIFIKDTTVTVTRAADAQDMCRWIGSSELSGDANVTIISNGDFAALRLYSEAQNTEALTLEDNAKLRCLHGNAQAASIDYVDGLQVERGKLTLSGNSYLEAEGRPLEGSNDEGGCGVFSGGDIEVKDNARLVTRATGWSLGSEGNLVVSGPGACVEAHSNGQYGIYLEGGLTANPGARIVASGTLSAIFSEYSVEADGATLVVKSQFEEPIVAQDAISIKNSVIDAGSGAACKAFRIGENGDDSTISVDGCWVNIPANNEMCGTVTNSVVFVGDNGTVVGNATTLGDVEIAAGQTLAIPAGASLTVASGTTFTNNGSIQVLGNFDAPAGTLVCNSHSGGAATCTARAVCAVCGAEYGELAPGNHAHGLKRVEAKAATADAEGNVAYWQCPDCGKCFSDEAAANEIPKASTVLPKLAAEQKPASEQKPAADMPSASTLPATGDAGFALAAAFAFLGLIAFGGAAVACKRR